MVFKDYHIIVIPKDKDQTKTFKISGFTLKVLLFTVILSVPLFFVAILSTIHYQNKLVALKRNNYENRQLIENRNELITQLASLEKTLTVMDDSILHLGELMDVDPQSLSFGTGPIADLDGAFSESSSIANIPSADTAIDGWIKNNGELSLDRFNKKIGSFKEESALLNKKLEQIFKQNKDKIRFVNATPNVLPVQGWVTSSFGMRRHPMSRRFKMHSGIDVASPRGTPIKSPAPGKVIFAGRRSGYGNMVLIDHGYGIVTVYAHLNKIFVKNGVKISRDELFATVGSTGASTGPHLHYEVQVDGIPSDPLAFVMQ